MVNAKTPAVSAVSKKKITIKDVQQYALLFTGAVSPEFDAMISANEYQGDIYSVCIPDNTVVALGVLGPTLSADQHDIIEDFITPPMLERGLTCFHTERIWSRSLLSDVRGPAPVYKHTIVSVLVVVVLVLVSVLISVSVLVSVLVVAVVVVVVVVVVAVDAAAAAAAAATHPKATSESVSELFVKLCNQVVITWSRVQLSRSYPGILRFDWRGGGGFREYHILLTHTYIHTRTNSRSVPLAKKHFTHTRSIARSIFVHLSVYLCRRTHARDWRKSYTDRHAHAHTHTYIHVYICIHTHIHTYINRCIYIHTHTYMTEEILVPWFIAYYYYYYFTTTTTRRKTCFKRTQFLQPTTRTFNGECKNASRVSSVEEKDHD